MKYYVSNKPGRNHKLRKHARPVALCARSLVITICLLPSNILAQQVLQLYSGEIPFSIAGRNKETGLPDGVTKVSVPTLTLFLPQPADTPRTAVIICPGGGYGSLVMDREGYRVAKRFAALGVASFVLKYRLPDTLAMTNRSLAPLQDAQEAIKHVRANAKRYNVDSNKIGIMGFSAGGHLAATAGTHFGEVVAPIENSSNKKEISLRPDFMILVYPVISFMKSLVHEGSMRNLLGQEPSSAEIAKFSNELWVTPDTPPAFLVLAANDKWVPPGNSIKFHEALTAHKVPAELHIYSKGDHGFIDYPPIDEWMGQCENWMRINDWIKK